MVPGAAAVLCSMGSARQILMGVSPILASATGNGSKARTLRASTAAAAVQSSQASAFSILAA